MVTQRVLGGICILLLAALACSGVQSGPNVQETIDAAVQSTQDALGENGSVETPNSPISSPFTTTPTLGIQGSADDESKPCGANKWRLIAVSKSEEAHIDGWKWVYVQLAVRNGSSLPGQLFIGDGSATTEGGFTSDAGIVSGAVHRAANPIFLFPGFIMNGETLLTSPHMYNPLVLEFLVAETENKLTITIPVISVICRGPKGEPLDEPTPATPLTVDVDEDLSQPLDFAAQLENLKGVENGIDFKDLGHLEFISATREKGGLSEEGTLTLRFNFQNTSSVYKVSGVINSYLLDDSGAVHLPYMELFTYVSTSGIFEAEPSQSSEVEFKYVIAKPADKFAFVVEFVHNSETSKTSYIEEAFRLP